MIDYYIDPKLKKYLDETVKVGLSVKDKDFLMVVSGFEGVGKSLFAIQVANYVDPNFNLDNVCLTSEEFIDRVNNAPKNSAIVFDEAVDGLSSGNSISKMGKLLKSLLMQCRQKNLFLIVVIPSIFELNRYTILWRCQALFHVYESKGRRGYFAGYNRRDLKRLYFKGKKDFSMRVRSPFRGRFYGKYPIDEQAYRKKKSDALKKIDLEEKSVTKHFLRDQVLFALKKEFKLNVNEMAKAFDKYGIALKRTGIYDAIANITPKMGMKVEEGDADE